jgi:glyoxylase-like metal-dependent hydrolase (beta-lactamase superfamily II)
MEGSGWPGALPRAGNLRLERLESAEPWFEAYRVGEGTVALLEARHYEEVISYLILGAERAILFDTGMGIGNIQMAVERLTDLPVVVINSHSHYDHVGDNHRFGEVWAYDDDEEVARIERGLTAAECAGYLEAGSYLDLPAGFDAAAYQIRPSPVTRRLQHLETVDLGGRRLTVHHTPGHSPGSLCLLDGRDGLLFTGDAFYPGLMYADFAYSDFDAYLHSLEHLASLLDQVSHLCPAHNEAYVPNDALMRALGAFRQIAAGQASYEVEESIRVYRFEGFGLTLADVPAGQAE